MTTVRLFVALFVWFALLSFRPFAPPSAQPAGDALHARPVEPAQVAGAHPLAALATPVLSLPHAPILVVDRRGDLPVMLDTGGHQLGAVAFSLDLDPTCLAVDAGDANTDGLPHALSGVPAGFVATLQFDAADVDGELDIALYDVSMPVASLPDGLLLTIRFEVPGACAPGGVQQVTTPLAFSRSPAVVFASTVGTRVEGSGGAAGVTLLFRHAPTDLALSPSVVAENLPPGAQVGVLTATDQDAVDAHSYTLLEGGEFFTVAADRLLTKTRFDFEQRALYPITVRATDGDGLSVTRTMTVAVADVNEPPHAVDDWIDPATTVFVGAGGPVHVLDNDSDPDRDTQLAIVSLTAPSAGDATTGGQVIVYDPPDRASGAATFTYQVADSGPLPLTDTAAVTLTYVADDARGDCNADGQVNAADLSAAVLELFDQPAAAPWYEIHARGYPGSPQGCDANADHVVEAADLSCAAGLTLGRACTPTAAAAESRVAPGLSLHLSEDTLGLAAEIRLSNPSRTATAVVFTLRYDPGQAYLDPTDADGDGVPDAILWSLPPQAQAWAFVEPGVLQVAAVMVATPPLPLPDGALVRANLVRRGFEDPAFGFQHVSAGDTAGSSVTVLATPDALPSSARCWLPLAGR